MTNTHSIPIQLSNAQQSRFWAKVDKGITPDDCWIWIGAKHEDGYGLVKISGKLRRAHRVSFELAGGTFDHGPLVIHGACNNPSCVNPAHLSSGSYIQNEADKKRDKTISPATGNKHGAYTKPECVLRGSKNGNSKLSEDQVITIRSRYSAGGITMQSLANKYGVSQPLIGMIIRRKKWKHLQ